MPPAGKELEPHGGFPAARAPPHRTTIAAARLLERAREKGIREKRMGFGFCPSAIDRRLEPRDGFPAARVPPRWTTVIATIARKVKPEL
uniref:Uncharacterized protein n=1 Tax=Oryza glumipatula TaxID=40148 RepID=A0A0E0AIE2_9ORYZ